MEAKKLKFFKTTWHIYWCFQAVYLSSIWDTSCITTGSTQNGIFFPKKYINGQTNRSRQQPLTRTDHWGMLPNLYSAGLGLTPADWTLRTIPNRTAREVHRVQRRSTPSNRAKKDIHPLLKVTITILWGWGQFRPTSRNLLMCLKKLA